MAEYIEREAFLETAKANDNVNNGMADLYDVRCMLEDTPTADVVEVVRCKDCAHKVDFKGRVMCSRRAHRATYNNEWYGLTATDSNHFCSYGAKMDGKGEGE